MSSSDARNFDQILETYVGGSGIWQWTQLCLILLNSFATAMAFLLHIFSAYTPNHRCLIPNCENDGGSYDAQFISFSIPTNELSTDFLNTEQTISSCLIYVVKRNNTMCTVDSFDRKSMRTCDDYVYDKSVFEKTLVTEFDLVCGESFKVGLLGSLLMVGLILGSAFGGPLTDKLGRRKTLVGALSILAPAVILEGFVPEYYTFACLRLTVFACVGVMRVASHTLLLEIFGTKHRKVAFTINSLMFSVFPTLQALVAYLEREWRHLHIYVGLLIACTVPILGIFLKESIRWQLANGLEEKAGRALLEVSDTNGKCLSHKQREDMKKHIDVMASKLSEHHSEKSSVLSMFKKKHLITTLILLTISITNICSFYSLALNVGSLSGDIFLNYILLNLVDVPATLYILLTVDRFGRKSCIITAQTILGICCLGMGFTPKEKSKVITALYLFGRFAATMSINTSWYYTSELFPTNMRAQSVAVCALVGRIFGVGSSFLPALSVYWSPLPMVVLGLPALMSAVLTLFLPETKGKDLNERKIGLYDDDARADKQIMEETKL